MTVVDYNVYRVVKLHVKLAVDSKRMTWVSYTFAHNSLSRREGLAFDALDRFLLSVLSGNEGIKTAARFNLDLERN